MNVEIICFNILPLKPEDSKKDVGGMHLGCLFKIHFNLRVQSGKVWETFDTSLHVASWDGQFV